MAKKDLAAPRSEDLAGGPTVDFKNAPLPTRATLRRRKALIRQFFKFLGFNLTIMKMVSLGHHPKH